MATKDAKGGHLSAYVGSYTTRERKARGDGIHVYSVDAKNGQWAHVQHIGNETNPSFFRVNHAGTRLYSVHGDLDYVSAFAIEPGTGRLSSLGRTASGGKNGVSLAVDPDDRHVIVANYQSSNLAVLPIAPDGSLRDPSQVVVVDGKPSPIRRVGHQEHAHPHDVAFDPSGRYVLAVDKGCDGISVYRFENGLLQAHRLVQTRGGAGPRHIAFDPSGEWAWVCNELDSSVTAYRWDAGNGSLIPVDMAWTVPPDFVGESTTAEIVFHPGTRTLYVSNRGHDSVAMFRVAQNGSLTAIGQQRSAGKTPRFIAIDPAGRLLYVANEDSDSIVSFSIDPGDGRLSPTGAAIANGSPVTIVFA